MRAFLHTDLRVAGNTLVDPHLGLRYSLTPDAAWLVRQLQVEARVDELVRAAARYKNLPPAEAKTAVYALLGQLAEFGGVRLGWGSRSPFFLLMGLRFRIRQPATAGGFIKALWRAYGLVFMPLELFFVGLWLMADGVLPLSFALLPAVVVGSLAIHELGHIMAAMWSAVPVALLSRIGYFGMLYRRPRSSVARAIAAAGPLAACLICGGVAAICQDSLLSAVLFTATAIHAINLLPFFADGRALWRYL